MERIFNFLFKAVLVGAVFIAGLQVGIWHGRMLEREETRKDVEVYKTIIKAQKETTKTLTQKLEKYIIRDMVITCESSYRSNARRGKAYGILQIKPSTWRYFLRVSGLKGLNYRLPYHQIIIFDWIYEHRPDLLRHWECYQKIARRWR